MPDTAQPLPVIAAIPNYNMAGSLRELLPQLLAQGYDKIYVLDDASTDDSQAVAEQFAPQVIWVGNTVNTGAGGARNRILDAHKENCIIHFLDADIQLLSNDMAAKARQVMTVAADTAFVGGLVQEKGKQSIWNFGQYPTFSEVLIGLLLLFGCRFAGRPRYGKQSVRLPVFWVHEANMLITRDTLEKIGGFDAGIREHDIMTPAYYARQQGLQSYFDPLIAVEHTQLKVRGYNRRLRRIRTARYLRRKFGMSIWA